jgi:hypothetical protein
MSQKGPHENPHQPGRSFEDPRRPLGEELLHQSPRSETIPEDFTPRERQVEKSLVHGVAERAKAIAVMRKAEELMSEQIPPATSDSTILRALELAAGRVGLTFAEYRALVKDDPELAELERKVIENARLEYR